MRVKVVVRQKGRRVRNKYEATAQVWSPESLGPDLIGGRGCESLDQVTATVESILHAALPDQRLEIEYEVRER